MNKRNGYVAVLLTTVEMIGGCASSNLLTSPATLNRLKTVSAGYTGCAPQDNALSDVVENHDARGSGTWNATCNGRVYLCSSVSILSESEPAHCASVAK